MRLARLRYSALLVTIAACSEGPTGPSARPTLRPTLDVVGGTGPQVVISQIYGGGGNSGATLKNDFVELHNLTATPISLAGWSVQYASAAGTTWQVTTLTGTIPAGGFFLVKEAAGTAGTADLPTPDVTGTIPMSATAGKIALSNTAVALSAACPTSTALQGVVSFGAASDCGFGTTPAPSNTNAVLRGGNGCATSGVLSADFAAGLPVPRNSASSPVACSAPSAPATVTVAPTTATLVAGTTQTFVATARDATNTQVSTTFTWASSNTAVATVDATGLVSALAAGTATISATSANSIVGSASLTVAAPVPTADIVISQVYGGGGNSGAPYTNDYVELFNRGATSVDLTGWRVHYSSAAGTTWQSTDLAGTIAPHGYLLVQEAAGAAIFTPLPTPDVIGAIPMGATSGKIVLTTPGITLAVACPVGVGIIDKIGYGSNSSDAGCGTTWGSRTGDLSNTTAAFRKNDGCISTANAANDFTVLSPNPRNAASTPKDCTQPTRTQSTASLVINELMGDPASAESASWGQWFEVRNTGATPIDLKGWTIISDGTSQPNHRIATNVIVPAGGYAVLGRGADVTRNGGVTLDYNYFTGTNSTIWLDQRDFLMLVDSLGARVDSVAWTSLPHGVTKGLRDGATPHADADAATWGYATTRFGDGDYGTPRAANEPLATTAPFVSSNRLTFSGRTAADAPLPVGFEAQLFATELDAGGAQVPTTFTWTSLTPDIATIDANGVMHALAAGTARFRAVAADGALGVVSLPTIVPVASATAVYLNNADFGEPTDADPSDDYLVRRPQYTTSYNSRRGIPNWVAYDLNATDIQPGQDRCNCFTFDPLLPASFLRYTTADYTGAGAFAGYGIDRGHLARSFDRTGGTLDNATTFYFDNIVPQASDLNQGPWAILENYLGDLATTENKEVYIYAGPAGSKGTVKNEGKITIPQYTWKVALVLNRGQKAADVHDYRDVDVVSVVMPNEPGVRSVDWTTAYRVTVDSIEHLTGYRFLTALAPKTARALKSGTKPPLAALNGPYAGAEGSAIAMSGAASIDPNGSITSYAWSFGDGTTASGAGVAHTYTRPGSYAVQLVVTDNDALADTISTTAQVTNVAPVIASVTAPTTPQRVGIAAPVTVSFSDVGTGDVHSATIAWGDGTTSPATISESAGSGTGTVSHAYATAGFYQATIIVSDDGGLSASTTTSTIIVVDPTKSLRAEGWIPTADNCSTGTRCRAENARAQFDIEVSYARRGDRLNGEVQISLRNADLEFTGRSTDWLVASDTTAVASGHGRVKGRDGFAFLVSAIDGGGRDGREGREGRDGRSRTGSPDRIRIKIWNEATGAVLFDSQAGEPNLATPTTVLGNGSVRIGRSDGREVSDDR